MFNFASDLDGNNNGHDSNGYLNICHHLYKYIVLNTLHISLILTFTRIQ